MVHLGTPCSTWSIARRNIKDFGRARARDFLGVGFALFSQRVIHECLRVGACWSLENPQSSRLWRFPPISALRGTTNFKEIIFDHCRYGRSYKKPTAIWTNTPALEDLGGRCLGGHFHVHLQGSQTKLAGEYHAPLCRRWARALLAVAPASAFVEAPSLRQAFRDGLAAALRVGGASHRNSGHDEASRQARRYLSRHKFDIDGREVLCRAPQ